ncbi:MAG: helix-turn-helix domain-containing protein [Chloroflexota bacterium]
MDEKTASFGEWLRVMCERQGLSLRQAGQRAGLSHGTIEGIIQGTMPSADTVKKLARAFGGDGREGLALEDTLLVLAGYRTPRSDDMSQSLAHLMDLAADLDESKLKLLADFVDYLKRMDKRV